jgi:hypothetical protein
VFAARIRGINKRLHRIEARALQFPEKAPGHSFSEGICEARRESETAAIGAGFFTSPYFVFTFLDSSFYRMRVRIPEMPTLSNLF